MRRLFCLLTALVILTVPAPATADEDHYTWITCPEGTSVVGILDLVTGLDIDGFLAIVVEGRITPCRATTGDDAYALAIYRPASATGHAIAYRAGPAETRTFMKRRGMVLEDTTAVCLLQNADVRLDCYSVTFTWQGGYMVAATARISVDSPAVRMSASVSMSKPVSRPGHIPPACPTCWG